MARKAGSEDDAPPPRDHNLEPLTKDEKAALLTVHYHQARQDNKRLDEAKAVVKAVNKERKINRNLVNADGFSVEIMDRVLEDEQRPLYEIEEYEDMRSFMREVAALPVGTQPELPFSDSFSDEERQKDRWTAKGFTEGLRGGEYDDPECPPEFQNDYRTAYEGGQAKLAVSKEMVERISARTVN